MEDLCKKALDLGATRAAPISPKDVIIDLRVRLKCQVPRCRSYGENLTCPPNCLSVEEFKEFLECYEQGVFIQLDYQIPKKTKSKIEDTDSLAKLYLDKQYLNNQNKNTQKGKESLNDIITNVESEAFSSGYYFATGFVGGGCSKCETCVGPGNPCRFPFYARPSLEAVGIDVFKTAERVGFKLEFPVRDRIVWSGMVLVK